MPQRTLNHRTGVQRGDAPELVLFCPKRTVPELTANRIEVAVLCYRTRSSERQLVKLTACVQAEA